MGELWGVPLSVIIDGEQLRNDRHQEVRSRSGAPTQMTRISIRNGMEALEYHSFNRQADIFAGSSRRKLVSLHDLRYLPFGVAAHSTVGRMDRQGTGRGASHAT